MAESKWVIKDYEFQGKAEYETAKKEAETVEYIKANMNFSNEENVLKVYNKLLDKENFRTIIGYEFLLTLRRHMIKNKMLPEENVRPIPIYKIIGAKKEKKEKVEISDYEKEMKRYQLLYENLKAKRTSSKIIIAFLALIIAGMLAITFFSDNSVISNYENKIINKYENWQQQLETKEKELNEREKNLKNSVNE